MQKNFSSKWSWWAYVLLVLGVILVLLLIWLLVVELIAYIQILVEAKPPTSADPTAISAAIAALIAGIVTVFGVAIAIFAGFYAKGQLLAAQEQLVIAQKIAHHDYLLRLDEAFRQYQDIRQKLRKGGDWYEGTRGPHFPEDLAVVEGYLALFERVQALIDDGILDIKSVTIQVY